MAYYFDFLGGSPEDLFEHENSYTKKSGKVKVRNNCICGKEATVKCGMCGRLKTCGATYCMMCHRRDEH